MSQGITTKVCTKCKVEKPVTDFPKRGDKQGGVRSRCTLCHNNSTLDYYHNRGGKELQRERSHKYILKKYGLTVEDYKKMLESQEWACKICGAKQAHRKSKDAEYKLFVDHCHTTGKVRGLLCHNCNAGLGHFKDDKTLMAKAMEYLDANSS